MCALRARRWGTPALREAHEREHLLAQPSCGTQPTASRGSDRTQRRGLGRPDKPVPTVHGDEVWLDVDRRLRRRELDAEGAIKELFEAQLIDKATGWGDASTTGTHWILGAHGFQGPVFLMTWDVYGGRRLYAPMHRESWYDARRRH